MTISSSFWDISCRMRWLGLCSLHFTWQKWFIYYLWFIHCHWYCCLFLHIFLSVGVPWAIMGTPECQATPARGVIAARTALFTGTVTEGLDSASAGQGPRGSDARNVNPGTFWWKAIVFVGIFLPECLKVVFPLNSSPVVFLLLRPMASAGESPILTKHGCYVFCQTELFVVRLEPRQKVLG